MLRTVLFGMIIAATPLAAQKKSGLVGNWKLSYPAGARFENGEMTTIMGTGLLTVRAQGDSLLAILVREPLEGQPTRPPLQMSAFNAGDSAAFHSKSAGVVDINGEKHPVVTSTTWSLAAKGDKLEGTLASKVEGLETHAPPSQGPQRVTGTRQPD